MEYKYVMEIDDDKLLIEEPNDGCPMWDELPDEVRVDLTDRTFEELDAVPWRKK